MFGFIVIYILTMHISTVPCMKTAHLPFINKLIYTKAHSNDILTARIFKQIDILLSE